MAWIHLRPSHETAPVWRSLKWRRSKPNPYLHSVGSHASSERSGPRAVCKGEPLEVAKTKSGTREPWQAWRDGMARPFLHRTSRTIRCPFGHSTKLRSKMPSKDACAKRTAHGLRGNKQGRLGAAKFERPCGALQWMKRDTRRLHGTFIVGPWRVSTKKCGNELNERWRRRGVELPLPRPSREIRRQSSWGLARRAPLATRNPKYSNCVSRAAETTIDAACRFSLTTARSVD